MENAESKEGEAITESNEDEPLDLSTTNEGASDSPSNLTQDAPFQSHHPFSVRKMLGPMRSDSSSLSLSPTFKDTTASMLCEIKESGSLRMELTRPQSEIRTQSIGLPATAVLRPILRTRGKERSLLICSVCGKAFDRPSLLKRHMRTHTGEKPNVCDVCGKGFSTSSSLNTHRRIHTGEKPHVCPVCGKRFTASSNLYYHRMTHNKVKPHACFDCGKSFPTPGDLKSHQYVHTGTWPFTCPVCQRGFSKQTNLRNHLLLHSGAKPHSCSKCEKKFALACNLRAHLKTHEEVIPSRRLSSLPKCLSCRRPSVSLNLKGSCEICTNSSLGPTSPLLKNVNPTKIEMTSESSPMGRQFFPTLSPRLPFLKTFPMMTERGSQLEATAHPGSMNRILNAGFGTYNPNPLMSQILASWNSQFPPDPGFLQQKLLESQVVFGSQTLPSIANYIFPFSSPIIPLLRQDTGPDWSSDVTNLTQ